jgi:hypothetical protein
VSADDKRQRALTGHLNAFYDTIIGKIATAEVMFIFGPGEAKGELKRRLEHRQLGSRVSALETADKLADRQISAKVREYSAPAERSPNARPSRAIPTRSDARLRLVLRKTCCHRLFNNTEIPAFESQPWRFITERYPTHGAFTAAGHCQLRIRGLSIPSACA